MPRRTIVFAITLAVTISVVASWSSGTSAQEQADRRSDDHVAGVGRVTWGPCDDRTLASFDAECGLLSVPLDYSKPAGSKIRLALSRVRHTVPDDEYQGIMLVNPGGPGGSGLVFAILGAFVPGGAGEAYDWIGFDPRGVGDSVPSLHCQPTYSAGPRPPYDPANRYIEAAWLDKVAAYADDCRRAGGRLLDHVKTIDNAQDMNAIRWALGESKLNYYGFSYGTYLGQVFATEYPTRVRRMVLDANVDPRRVWYDANLDQDVAFETVIQRFFAWVGRHDNVYQLGRTRAAVQAKYYAALNALAVTPQGGELGAAEWNDAFVTAGYTQGSWPDIAAGFAAFVNDHDAGPVIELFHNAVDTTDDNGYAMYLATECTEGFWPRKWSTWRRDNASVARDAPFLTWANAWFNAPCIFWPAESSRRVDPQGHKLPPILLLSETLDAATPFSGSLEVRERFQSASLIATEGGTTHANSLAGNACVDDKIAAYLADGSTPDRRRGNRSDVVCPAAPEPEPLVAKASARTNQAVAADARQILRSILQGR